jgi:hypothetical protein
MFRDAARAGRAAHRPDARPHARPLRAARPRPRRRLAGDALVAYDPYTARTGPRLVARAATVDSERNRTTLEGLAATDARYVLTGHGPVWDGGARAAVAAARAAPVA